MAAKIPTKAKKTRASKAASSRNTKLQFPRFSRPVAIATAVVLVILAIITLRFVFAGDVTQPELWSQSPLGSVLIKSSTSASGSKYVQFAPAATPLPSATSANCTPSPTGGDDTANVNAAILACATVNITKPLIIDGGVVVNQPNRTITWSGTGKMTRRADPLLRKDGRPVISVVNANTVHLVNPQIVGGSPVLDTTKPHEQQACGYASNYETNHGIQITGAQNVTIDGGLITQVHGDGVYIIGDSSNVTLNQITVSCVGRAAVTNLASAHTRINQGVFENATWWIFNVEIQSNSNVTDYVIDRPYIGRSTREWLLAVCHFWESNGYTGHYEGLVVNKPTFLTPLNRTLYVANCQAPGTQSPTITF